MPTCRNLIVISGWGKLRQLGHRVSIGFALPQLFRNELGQLGQICFREAQDIPTKEIVARDLSLMRHFHGTFSAKN